MLFFSLGSSTKNRKKVTRKDFKRLVSKKNKATAKNLNVLQYFDPIFQK